MLTLPPYRFLRFRFYAPKGVEDVIACDGSITGRWAKPTTRFYSETENTVAQRFANSNREESDILAFTKRFGPLSGSPDQGREFSFTVESWRANQRTFRQFWSQVKAGMIGPYKPLEGSAIEIRKRWLDFRCTDLWIFMSLELLAAPEKLRFCLRPGCAHPYFIAQHGKERYCSTDCANWSQTQLKSGGTNCSGKKGYQQQ